MSSRSKADKFKAFRAARAAKSSLVQLSDEEDDNVDQIYDEVDEESFRKHKRDQLLNDDFIVDDNGEGYVDTGVDEWDNRNNNHYSSEDDAQETVKEVNKKKRKIVKTAPINNFFKSSTTTIADKPRTKIEANVDDILEDVFDEPKNTKKAKKSANIFAISSSNQFSFNSKPVKKKKKEEFDDFNNDMDVSFDNYDAPSSPIKNVKKEQNDDSSFRRFTPDSDKDVGLPTEKVKAEIVEEDDDESSEDEVVVTRRPRAGANISRTTNFSAIKDTKPVYTPMSERMLPASSPSRVEKLDETSIKEGTKNTFKMFWIDYAEVDNSLLLFGKIKSKNGEMVSGMVQINGICKELFFLPRQYRKVDGELTDEEVGAIDVHAEIVPLLLDKFGLENIRAKPQTMKYAFELPDIPKETEYLKVLLPYKTTKSRNVTLPADLEGETFHHVFGSSANIFENFVVQRNIMGPCWLEIEDGDFGAISNTSHCRVEVSVDSPASIKTVSENMPAPPLTVTSIQVQTVMNVKENKQEVAAVSIATYRDLPQDAPIDENMKPHEVVTLVRPVGSVNFPPGLAQLAKKQEFALRTFANEKTLLNCVAALIKVADPDIFIGHRLENISLDVLVHRMYDLKIMTWSTFGRRNRKTWPDRFGRTNKQFGNINLQLREIFAGRLLCDIANEMGQSLTSKCQSWDLPEMYEVVCKRTISPLEINYLNPRYSEDSNMLLMALKENASNVLISAEIAFRIQILSLSKQLTNLAGNAWSHTLGGTRAGRNEYILLHEFTRNSYIVPDKENRWAKAQQNKIETEEEDATTATSNKKPKYQGGLVFEPEKGLHKNYILVMDFNSLYPSIIQEFNICFTTVDRRGGEEELPQVPAGDQNQGVLPRLLATLVNRRREVKKLLKDPKATPIERAQYDIKQQALKLTANSMYGCLGYVNSRFYAKPLAMLVTNKGREILMDTRQLAESIDLRVVYGDTDSVMIDTGCDNFPDAIKIGEEFKIKVNERYRLLEIDIDNVFKRLLLHAKKKYAAMNVTFANGQESATLEVKGLDMRRREYSQVSKDISTYVLEQLLSDTDPEVVLSTIYSYLEEMTTKIKNNEIRIDKFKINTRLSKDPSAYSGGKSMPPVQVALRLREQGKVIKAGSVITYVITDAEGDSPAERARAFQEVMAKNSTLKPDADYYLEKQIFAPVERLVERIEGIDMVRIASSLAIDTKRYELRMRNLGTGSGDIQPLESTISDSERFRDCAPLELNCSCGSKFAFGGVAASNDYKMTFNGIQCARCQETFSPLRINSQLERVIRSHISLYYSGWLACDDAACGIVTRQISVYGKRCIGISGKSHGCKGIMRYRYSDKALYNQLLYFDSIFDVDKAKKSQLKPIYDPLDKSAPTKLIQGQIEALSEQNRDLFEISREVVKKYLSDCGRRYVDMGSIFDFMAMGK